MSSLVIVKLGGSLITHKRRPRTARPAVIQRLAAELAKGGGPRRPHVLVGHGSGSFGHDVAARFELASGVREPRQLEGVSLTQAVARALTVRITDALHGAGLRPFTLSPSSFCTARAGKLGRVQTGPLEHALDAGLLPVVHGDIVLDAVQGAAICSTEAILTALAERLQRQGRRIVRALWLGDTDGVYDDRGRTVPELDHARWQKIASHVGGARGTDVTGGMRLRVSTALRLARMGIPSWIGDGRVAGQLQRALGGRPRTGTWVPAERTS